MTFTKIKWNGKEVFISWVETRSGVELEHVLKSFQTPAPEMTIALTSFIPLVLQLLDLPVKWEDRIKVTGLSINEEEDGRSGLVITSIVEVERANSPLVFNTPHLRQPVKAEEFDAVGFYLDGMEEAVATACKCAKDYIDGKREQRDMFDKDDKGKAKPQLALVGAGSENGE